MLFLKQQICIEQWFSTLFCTASPRSIIATHYNQPPHLKLDQIKCNTAACIKNLLATPRKMVHHTQNSNHLDQNIDLSKHKLTLLVNDNAAECNVAQKKETITKLSTMAL